MSLGGNVCIRDGDKLDYPWRECIQSLLPVCDVVVACDGGSTDGTLEEIKRWCEREPKLRLCEYPWPNPKGDIEFWVHWLNYCREHIPCTHHIQLDADEVLDERSYRAVRHYNRDGPQHTLWCRRLNFWRDHRHLIPEGVCCSHRVCRLAPQSMWLPSDGPHPKGSPAIQAAEPSNVVIHHYGFLRRKEAFFEKAKALQSYFFDGYDQRLVDVERLLILEGENSQKNWMQEVKGIDWIDRLVPYDGHHPAIAHQWLRDRGYEC
jgi:glycosyltransferase involved in cell wall biosynthesis